MSDHRNGMRKQGKDQTPLHGQQKFNDDKEDQNRTSLDLSKAKAAEPPKRPARQSGSSGQA